MDSSHRELSNDCRIIKNGHIWIFLGVKFPTVIKSQYNGFLSLCLMHNPRARNPGDSEIYKNMNSLSGFWEQELNVLLRRI